MTPSEIHIRLQHSTAQQEYVGYIIGPRLANRAIIQTCVACLFSLKCMRIYCKPSSCFCRWSALTCPPWNLDQQFSVEAWETEYNGSSSGLFPHPPMPSELVNQVHQSCQATYPERISSSPLRPPPHLQPAPSAPCALPPSSTTASPRLVNKWPLLGITPMMCSLLCSISKLRLGSRSVWMSS